MLAMLARTPGGTRSRAWLMDRLWSQHDREAAMNGLRRELSQLRRACSIHGADLIGADSNRVWLKLDHIMMVAPVGDVELLEGIDIAGEEEFEDWLRTERAAPLPTPPAPPLPLPDAFADRPALALLPIIPMGNDPDIAWLAQGLFDELVETVARLRWLPVMTSAAVGEPQDIARSLGASYVFHGRLIQQHGSYWLSCTLLDVPTGRVLWQPRLALAAPHAAGALNPMISELATVIDWRIDDAEQSRATATPDTALGLRELIWRGRWHQHRLTTADMAMAGQYFRSALDQAPNSALALIEWTHHLGYMAWNGRADSDGITAILDHARRAMILDPHDPRGHMLAGMAETWLRRSEPAELLLRRALELNPSLPMTLDQLATLYNLSGRSAQAIEPLELSVRLSPSDFRLFYKHGELALAHLFCGRPDAAIGHARQSLSLRPSYWYAHMIQIAALVEQGCEADARAEYRRLRIHRPNFQPDYVDWIPFVDKRHNDFLKTIMTDIA
jgi:TolB-like protein